MAAARLLTIIVVFIAVFTITEGRVNVFEITTKQVFDIAVLKNQKRPVFVFFTKPSCGGGICARLQADLEDLARQNEEKMNLAIVDLEKKPEFRELFGIARIPTTRVYFKGNMVDQVQGPSLVSITKMADRVLESN